MAAPRAISRIFEEARIPRYEGAAVSGFMHMVKWRQAREALMVAPPSMPVDFAPNVAKARAVIQQAIARGHNWLAPVEISALLEAYDIPDRSGATGALARRRRPRWRAWCSAAMAAAS